MLEVAVLHCSYSWSFGSFILHLCVILKAIDIWSSIKYLDLHDRLLPCTYLAVTETLLQKSTIELLLSWIQFWFFFLSSVSLNSVVVFLFHCWTITTDVPIGRHLLSLSLSLICLFPFTLKNIFLWIWSLTVLHIFTPHDSLHNIFICTLLHLQLPILLSWSYISCIEHCPLSQLCSTSCHAGSF